MNWFTSIRSKLVVIVVVIGVVVGSIVIAALIQMNRIDHEIHRSVVLSGDRALSAWKLKQVVLELSELEKSIILSQSAQDLSVLTASAEERLDDVEKILRALNERLEGPQRAQIEEFSGVWKDWVQQFNAVKILASRGEDPRGNSIFIEKSTSALDRIHSTLTELAAADDEPAPPSPRDGRQWMTSNKMEKLRAFADVLERLKKAETAQAVAIASGEASAESGPFFRVLRDVEKTLKLLDTLVPAEQRPALDRMKRSLIDYVKSEEQIFRSIEGDTAKGAFAIAFRVGTPLIKRCEKLLDSIITQNRKSMIRSHAEIQEMLFNAQVIFLACGIVGLVIGILLVARTARQIGTQISLLSDYARETQRSGDLSVKVPKLGNNEIGQLAATFENMRISLFKKSAELARVNRRLAYTNKKLEEKSQEMEQFVYTVSHDLKSPLVTCKGFIGLLREDLEEVEIGEGAIDSISRIDRACDQLIRIIDDLLEISRIGRTAEPYQTINTDELLQELEARFNSQFAQYGVDFSVSRPLPEVPARKTSLTRAFENLISNAIKYGRNGKEPKIVVGGDRTDSEVRFFVKDNGPGIEPQYQQRIFGLFQRLDKTVEGTGLGLASVAKIMQIHRGRAWVESQPGAGATFWLSFPSGHEIEGEE